MATPATPEILVIGAGVSGLTTAITLAEADLPLRVLVRATLAPSDTTSQCAGALWGPVGATHPRLAEWSQAALVELTKLADLGRPMETGVRLAHGVEAARVPMPPPAWLLGDPQLELRDEHPDELPEGFVVGWRYRAPVVDMPTYLRYLVARLERAGGVIELGTVASLRDPALAQSIVINCTGHEAREFVPDDQVEPVRGQVVVVENPGVTEFFAEADPEDHEVTDVTYFLPHGDVVVLGSTIEPGRFDREPDLKVAQAIVRRCAEIMPALADARVIEHRVGVRPARPVIRVEHEQIDGREVVHNYGHGGGGVSLSWGCAREVLQLIEDIVSPGR